MIVPDQSGTKRCALEVHTTTDTIIELGCHIEILVARGVMRFVKGVVVSDDVGDVAVHAVAELSIAVARGASDRWSECRSWICRRATMQKSLTRC